MWLTDDPAPADGEYGLASAYSLPSESHLPPEQRRMFPLSKVAVRFVVDVPDDEAHPWLEWSRRRGITKAWAAQLEAGLSPERWWLIERPVPRPEWVSIDGPRWSGRTGS